MAVIESATNGVPPTGEEGQKNHLNGENHVNGSGVDESPADDTVLIAGGGPVGLLLAFVLAHYGVRSIILERNHTTTKSEMPCLPVDTWTNQQQVAKDGSHEYQIHRTAPSVRF